MVSEGVCWTRHGEAVSKAGSWTHPKLTESETQGLDWESVSNKHQGSGTIDVGGQNWAAPSDHKLL